MTDMRLLYLLVAIVTVRCNIHDNLNCGESPVADQYYALSRTRTNRIVSGEDVLPNTWPWVGSLLRLGKHICGATLVEKDWVVTAAHCVAKYAHLKHLPQIYTVVMGKNSLFVKQDGQETARVKRIVIHPLFNIPKVRSRDLAILQLDRELNVSKPNIDSLCMPTHTPLPGTHCVVAGWGRVAENSAVARSRTLLDATVPMIPTFVCANPEYYFFLIDHVTMLCAGSENGGPDACQGDSGSPLMCMDPLHKRWQLHGVVSWGVGCGRPKRPGVYTNILPHVGWIRSQVLLYKDK